MVQLLSNRELGLFWKFALRCFFGEIGGKTFFIAVLLTAWVATWKGIRIGWQQRQHQLMVFVGTLAGLLAHTILVSLHATSASATSAFSFAGAALLVIMGMKLHLELQAAQARTSDPPSAAVKEKGGGWNPMAPQLQAVPTQSPWNSAALRAQPAAVQASGNAAEASTGLPTQGYGSMAGSGLSPMPDWAKEPVKVVEEERAPLHTLLLAGLLAMLLVFIVEVGDRGQLASAELKDAPLVFGAMLGYVLATCIAVLIGYLMESILHPDAWVLFAAEMGFFAMSLICLSQGVLSLSPLAVRQAGIALLGLGAVGA